MIEGRGLSRRRWTSVGAVVLSFGAGLLALPSLAQQPGAPSREQLAEGLRAWMTEYAELGDPGSASELSPFRPGYLEQFQLRSEADRLERGRQRYAVRFQPKMPHVRRAERDLQRAERAALVDIALPALRDADREALREVFRLASEATVLRVVDSLFALQQNLLDLTLVRLAEPNYGVERVLDAQDELSDLELLREELRRSAGEQVLPLPLGRVVDVAQIVARLDVLRQRGPRATDVADLNRLTVIDAELALERAENQRWLDFLQVDYRTDLVERNRRYSIGGGVDLPMRLSANTSVDKLRVERVEEEMEQAIERGVRERELARDLDLLALGLVEYEALERSLAERRRNRLPLEAVLARSVEADPEDVIRLRRRNLTDRLDLLEMAADIRDDYAALLAEHFDVDAALIAQYVLTD